MRVVGVFLTSLRYLLILGTAGFMIHQVLLPTLPSTIQIATGTEAGIYNETGESLRARLISYPELEGVVVNTKRTSGAIENEQLLLSNQVDAGFLQGDKDLPADLRLIARVYTEKLHIIVKRKNIRSIEDLRGEVIGVWSEPGSGTDRLLRSVLTSLGLRFQAVSDIPRNGSSMDVTFLYYEKERNAEGKVELNEPIHDFDADQIAALAAVAGDNSPFVRSRFTVDPLNRDNRLLELSLPPGNELLRAGRVYNTTISQAVQRNGVVTYPEGVRKTVGTDALLVARSGLSDPVAYQLARSVFDPDFEKSRPEVFGKAKQNLSSARLHPGTFALLKGESMPRSAMSFEPKLLLVLLILLVLLFAPRLLLVLISLNIPFIREAGPLFYGSIVGRFMIANALLKGARRNPALQRVRKEYVQLPMRLSGEEYKNTKELMAAFNHTAETLAVVQGEGGTGKTTFMTHVFDVMVADLNPRTPLPFLVTSPGFSSSLSASLIASMKRYGVYLNDEILDSLLLQSKTTVLIDGIDGLPASTREDTIKDVMELMNSYPLLSVILCARDPVLPRTPEVIETTLLDRKAAQSLFDQMRAAKQRQPLEISNDVLVILDRPLMVRLLVDTETDPDGMPRSQSGLLRSYIRELLREGAFGGMEYETCENILRKLAITLLFEKNTSRFTLEMAEETLAPVIQRLESHRGKLPTPYGFVRSAIAAGIIRREEHVLSFFHDFILNYFAALELREIEVSDPSRYRELLASLRGLEAFRMIPMLASQHISTLTVEEVVNEVHNPV